jgi:biotin carboxyl carrier protein
VEAMKMENPVRAHKAGRIDELGVVEGDTRAGGQLICFIRSVVD